MADGRFGHRIACWSEGQVPTPRMFWEKRLQTIENKGRERGKERKERYKRLQAAENMGFATETRRHRSPEQTETPPSPGVFVSAYSKGVTGEASVSAECKGLICTKIVQNATCHGSVESKGVTGTTWRRVYWR